VGRDSKRWPRLWYAVAALVSRAYGGGRLNCSIADRFGRKYAFYTLWLALVVAVALESFGRVWQTWLLAKLFSGFGELQQAEVAEPRRRIGAVHDGDVRDRARAVAYPGLPLDLLLVLVGASAATGTDGRYGLGQLCSSLALKVMNDNTPFDYLTPIYIEWAMIGIMLGIYTYIPESPYWCATHGDHDKGRAIIKRLNGGIDGYDVDFHYNLIRRAVEKEKSFQKQIDGDTTGFLQELANVKEVLVGINGVRLVVSTRELTTVPHPDRVLARLCPADRRPCRAFELRVVLCPDSWLRRSFLVFATPRLGGSGHDCDRSKPD